MAETKQEFQARLSKELKDLDTKEMAQKGWNPNALRLYLKAAKDVVDSSTFANAFTPTRGMHRVARNLGLGLDVERGKWIPKEQAMKKEQVNEWVQGSKLIELLVLALEEQNSVKVMEYVNKLLSFKISEALIAKRKTLAEEMFGVKSEDANEVLARSAGAKSNADAGGADELLNNPELGVTKWDAQADAEENEGGYAEGVNEPSGANPFRK